MSASGFQIPINPDVANIPYGDRKRIQEVTRGKTGLVSLSGGAPVLPLPPYVAQKLEEAARSRRTPYAGYWGTPQLRAMLSRHLADEWHIPADPEEEIIITIGVQEALYVVMRTLLTPGDEVLLPSPHYAEYYMDSLACGARPVLLKLEEEQGYVPDLARLEAAITPRTRALVFCNPSNPLGVVWSREVLEGIAEVVLRHDLVVVVDEIYRNYTYYDRPTSIASLPGMRERTFTLGGFSKSHMMMGLRVGFVVGPAAAIRPMKNLHYCAVLGPSSIGQAAAIAALECPREQVEPVYQEYGRRLDALYEAIVALPGVTCVRPQGSFYLFPNFSCFGMTAMQLAIALVEQAGVTTLPGTEFGPYGEAHLRLSVCPSPEEIETGLTRLRAWVANKEGVLT